MAAKAAHKRVRDTALDFLDWPAIDQHPSQLSKEYVAMQNDPPPFVWAVPDEKNILTCELIATSYSISMLSAT
jgi:hypothetical protein